MFDMGETTSLLPTDRGMVAVVVGGDMEEEVIGATPDLEVGHL